MENLPLRILTHVGEALWWVNRKVWPQEIPDTVQCILLGAVTAWIVWVTYLGILIVF